MDTPADTFTAPFPLRHECTGCGASCSGLRVWLGDQDKTRVEAAGVRLGVERPIDGDNLRREKGECVFLDGDRTCRVHSAIGYEEKPEVCRMYPMVMVRVEDGIRVAIDPGCFDHIRSWRTGQLVPDGSFPASQRSLPPEQLEAEAYYLNLCRMPGTTVASLLEALCSGRLDGGPGLPEGFDARWMERLQQALPALDAVLAMDEAGESQRRAWKALRPAIGGSIRPWPALAPDEDAFAVNVVHRALFLRGMKDIPVVNGAALLVASGAVLCAWAEPSRQAFGRNLAAWTRLLRISSFWLALTPDGDTMQWLARG